MNCLLVAATAKEISPFLAHYRRADNQYNVDVLITGVGLTATTYALTRQLVTKRPGIVIQAGIAGCFDRSFPLARVVAVKQDLIADLSVVESGTLATVFDLGLVKPNQYPHRNGWLVNPNKDLLKMTKLPAVKAISVNHITTNRSMLQAYQSRFAPILESMEGAAMHYTCLLEKVPFLQVRSISNYIGERNKAKWNIAGAIAGLNNKIIEIIQTINQQ